MRYQFILRDGWVLELAEEPMALLIQLIPTLMAMVCLMDGKLRIEDGLEMFTMEVIYGH